MATGPEAQIIRDELRVLYKATAESCLVGRLLNEAFMWEDDFGEVLPHDGFEVKFIALEGYDPDDVKTAWAMYQGYRKELEAA